jgi:hypothetical protein
MRGLIQFKMKMAIDSVIDVCLHIDRDRVIVFDLAQNLPLPHFGGEQPGEIYYLSSLPLNLFGIVDLSTSPNKLTCYVYKEFTAKEGSNNTSSMIMHYLHNKN